MVFIFSKTVRDVIRNRNLIQSAFDQIQQRKRGVAAPRELPNRAVHGITLNGTYFFCNLVYQKNITERKKITLFNLIESYANTEGYTERVKLKDQIKEACGEQVEGIALLFSNSNETYGFVTGKRIKVARYDKKLLELNADELFSEGKSALSFRYHVFILENEEKYAPELIKTCLFQGNEQDDGIDTGVINAIKYIDTFQKPLEDMSWYLKTAYAAIQDPALQQQVKSVYDALQLLSYKDEEIKYKATVLTLQLLHFQENEKRQKLLTEYTELASILYGSKIPTQMIIGISLFLLATSFLIFFILTAPVTLSLTVINTGFVIIGSVACGIVGKNKFYNDIAKQRRRTANMLFNLKENLNNVSEDLIPRKLIDPNEHSGERAWASICKTTKKNY